MHTVRSALDKILAGVCVTLFTALVLTVSWQVFSRQVLNDPSTWTEELARFEFVWLGMFGAALMFSERGHLAVDLVVRRLPLRFEKVIAVGVELVVIAFAAVGLVWGGWRAAQLAWTTALSSLPTEVGKMYLVLPITGAAIVFYAGFHIAAVLRGAEEPVSIDDVSETI